MSDARNIALTIEGNAAAEHVQERLRLSRKVDAVRVGLAYAYRHHLPLGREEWGRPGGTNYNVATVDTADGTFRRLLNIFYDDQETTQAPYHAIETLMNKGLLLLKNDLDDGTISGLADLVEEERDS